MSMRQLLRLYQKQQLKALSRRQDFPKNITLVDLPAAEREAEQPTSFKKGDQAPYAYNQIWEYPKDYQPWNFNYKGDGVLIGCLVGLFWAYFQYEETYLARTGRVARPEREYYQP